MKRNGQCPGRDVRPVVPERREIGLAWPEWRRPEEVANVGNGPSEVFLKKDMPRC